MNTWIALLRGINVGGHNSLRMKELRAMMESLGFENVATYIQSGNAVFDAEAGDEQEFGTKLADEIEKSRGFRPHVFILSAEHLKAAIEANPYPEADAAPKSLHVVFLASPPKNPDLDLLNEVKVPSEQFHLTDEVFYLHAPDGIGRSKLADRLGRALGVEMTARNWRTVMKLREMVEER